VFLWKVRLSVRKLCSVGCEARKQDSLFLQDVRVVSRKLCSVGCEARKQDSLFLQDMRVESEGSCVLVESEAISQEAVFCRWLG
jgi:hypothetical protein